MNFHNYLQRREYGMSPIFGERNFIMKRIYSAFQPFHNWNDLTTSELDTSKFGAVFNMEFSPEGNILVAACEKKSVCLFDALTTKPTHMIYAAHTDNVNCITFLDNRMFATCSDDMTVALWDLRFLKSKVRSLHGHSNWVKNVEYSQKDGLLVTSGFDGSVFVWDINSHTEQGLIYQKVFHTSGLMRCRISPDGEKMVICTTGGYLMVIHDLDLTTLHKDLCGFRPNIYRLMQLGRQYIPQAAKFDHLFSKKQKKNRVELVSDFPPENEAEVILALQIHPQGCSFLSRNKSTDEQSEWSCVHDISEEKIDITTKAKDYNKRKRKHHDVTPDGSEAGDSGNDLNSEVSHDRRYRIGVLRAMSSTGSPLPDSPVTLNETSDAPLASTSRQQSFIPDIWAAEVTLEERATRQNRDRSDNAVTGYNFVYAISSGVLSAPLSSSSSRNNNTSTSIDMEPNETDLITDSPPRPSTSSDLSNTFTHSPLYFVRQNVERPIKKSRWIPSKGKIFQNARKLVYYISESTSGKSYIKEPSFSSDGRIICSPYDMGVRLLAYDENCSEYQHHGALNDDSDKRIAKKLTEIKNIKCHDDIVLSTKFSPRQPLLVSGCRRGKIVWHHPLL